MSELVNKVFKTIFETDEYKKYIALEEEYEKDCQKFAAMSNEELAEKAAYYLKQMQGWGIVNKWPRGTPVYDAVMLHTILPELIKRIGKL